MRIDISREYLYRAADVSRESSATVRERALVSHSVALAIRNYIEQTTQLTTEPGRSFETKYIELLDICDFTVNNFHVEVRAVTNVDEPALYVPTTPLMVGLLSDFYVCAKVDPTLNHADIVGYARREDLANADLSSNGLFAVLDFDELKSFTSLIESLLQNRASDPTALAVYTEWQTRADRIVSALEVALATEQTFDQSQVQYLAARLHDDVLRVYGTKLPPSGLEPLFAQLFRRFGVEPPIPSHPDAPLVFENPAHDREVASSEETDDDFFQDKLAVRQRVSLYRHLLEHDEAFARHRKKRQILDVATRGQSQVPARRRAHVRVVTEQHAEASSRTEIPTREQVKSFIGKPERQGAKMSRLEDLKAGASVKGIIPDGLVTVIDAKWYGSGSSAVVELTYKDAQGRAQQEMLYRDREPTLEIVTAGRPWSFDGDGEMFRLASEAHRIQLAYLFDPLLAVHTSLVAPLPHQITAVYEQMLTRQPLRYLLADDPGAGKTIMSGLLLKELLARGDLKRCLICCPGILVEQWQDELYEKFHLDFKIMTREMMETARSGNAFAEQDWIICRLDQLSRNEDVQAKLAQTDWDIVICDEAHKMSAHFFGGEVKPTQRYKLGQLLGTITRSLLLLTATPHNGKEEDFQLFMALLDSDRFEGKFRDGVHLVDTSDLMRRMVKEQLLKFDGTPLFPERLAYTVNYPLSDLEGNLYREVTEYVREEMNRADRLAAEGEGRRGNTVGFALTILQRRLASSPEAIYQSLRRRRERLEKRLREERMLKQSDDSFLDQTFTPSLSIEDANIDEFYDESPSAELEDIEEEIVDRASAARTIAELEIEISSLTRLEELAASVRRSGTDRKWDELSKLLQGDESAEAARELVDENGSLRKLIIFSEHRDTLNYLNEKICGLIGREEAVVTIHGGIRREERRKIQQAFTQDKEVQILIATDAAGEGINLQRAHLMINYDLPWNPNRIEQRFGRIHRIGQTEVCHLWNLVSNETREGDVFNRLLSKLEQQRASLGGSVFDVLGNCFNETPLRTLLIQAIRYGDRPEVKARLNQVLDAALDYGHISSLIEERALTHETLSAGKIQQIREDMERAEARRLQPFFVSSFFRQAFAILGGTIREREPKRYEITHVPAAIRNRDRVIGSRDAVLARYERVTFEKNLINVPGKPVAAFLCPGHPLLDATIDLILERHRDLLKRGAILVDPLNRNENVRALFYLEHSIQDARKDRGGNRRIVSRQMQFVEIDTDETVATPGYAPYLDYRPATDDEKDLVSDQLEADWLRGDLESLVSGYAAANLIPQHFKEVKTRKEKLINKTIVAVKDRLTKEINHWDHRAEQLKEQELAGRPAARMNSGLARQRADELQLRLQRRMDELEQERLLSPLPPIIIGGAIVVPQSLIDQLAGKVGSIDEVSQAARERINRLAVDTVMQIERERGREPREMPHENPGYDIESKDPGSGRLFFIEVKGKAAGAQTGTISKTQILTALNKPDDFILALVEVEGDVTRSRYLKQPFQREPDFSVTSVNYDFPELFARGEVL
jgi:superfamily II DNA or RNA helicase